MKVLLFSGNHSRHVFVHKAFCERYEVVGIVTMKREDEVPSPPISINKHDRDLFRLHFDKRYEVEKMIYGNLSNKVYKDVAPTMYIEPKELNTHKIADFVKGVNADVCFIFGVDLILSPVIEVLPKWKINFHLGLSPWYKGSATLFWPFYFLQPQFAGATIHQIVPQADAGEIIHQIVPQLEYGDGIHDVGAKVVVKALNETLGIFDLLKSKGTLPLFKQKSLGRLFLTRDFQPSHLRLIYDLYEDKIVDAYLNGDLNQRKPRLINGLRK